MANTDIVARLQLNAEQFTSEAGRASADVAGKMTRAAAQIRQPFVSAFAEVQKIAARSLEMPRTTGGSLDLSAEIAELRGSAAASDQRATAFREMAIAMNAAAEAGHGDAQAMKLRADAAAVSSLAEEKLATSINEHVAALVLVQAELDRTASATRENIAVTEQAAQAQADLAQSILSAPRTQSGSLTLAPEIAELKTATAAAQQRAIALRELAAAQNVAAAAEGVDASALQADAAASIAAAEAIDREVAANRAKLASYEAVDAELVRTRSLTDRHVASIDSVTSHSKGMSASQAEMMHVVRSSSDAFAAGAPLQQIFAMEIGRVGQAAANSGGALGAVGTFLGGPWGLALTAGLAILTPFVGKLFETDDAADKAAADGLAKFEERQQSLARFIDTTNGKLDTQSKYLAQIQRQQLPAEIHATNVSAADLSQQAFTAARNLLASEGRSRAGPNDVPLSRAIDASNGSAILLNQNLRAIAGNSPALTELANKVAGFAGQIGEAQVKAQKLRSEQYDLNTALNGGVVMSKEIVEQHVAEALALTAVEKAQLRVQAAKEETARVDKMASGAAKDAAFRQSQADEIAAGKALQAAQADKKRHPSLGTQIETEQAQRLLTSAQSYAGLDENRDRGTLEQLFKSAHENVDPKMTAWCAAFVNAVLATNGLPGTGSLSARSFLGYGEKTEKPEKGDIVVSRRGTGDQGHVGFYEGLDAKGNVRVLGGNTGGKVATETVQRADVLGFRRAPTAAESYKADEQRQKQDAELMQRTGDEIARINAQWDEQPRLIDRANIETNKLDEIIAELSKRKWTPEVQALIDKAQQGKQVIRDGLDRPFQDFVKTQRESVAVQELSVQGRDVEAAALSEALRFQKQQKPLDDAHLAELIQIEAQQERIADRLEDQRRIVGLYGSAVGDMQQTFGAFLDDLDKKPGDAVKGLVSGFVDDFKKLRNSIISEQLFGGMQRDIERYVAQRLGGTSPADMLKQQLSASGSVLQQHVHDTGNALDDMTKSLRGAVDKINALDPRMAVANDNASPITGDAARLLGQGNGVTSAPDSGITGDLAKLLGQGNGVDDVVVSGTRDAAQTMHQAGTKFLSATELFSVAGNSLVTRTSDLLGIKMPAALEKKIGAGLGTLMQGVATGQLGGSVFASITGGKDNKLASGLGGAVGEVAGKALTKGLSGLLGSVGGPLGGIVGGVLGSLVGGLFRSVPTATASVGLGTNGSVVGGKGQGNDASSRQAATGLSGGVAQQLNQLTEQLGASISKLAPVTVGTFNGSYRVAEGVNTSASLNYNNFNSSTLKAFDDENSAIAEAVQYELQNSVISGISAASQKILASGQDLQAAITKVNLIESVPKDLKAMIDPVGAAVDTLNTKFAKIVAAMKEGGATADQLAQAQQLYKLQLDQVKASTDAADKTLQDFKTSLMLGSSSAYSLRDQETTAKANLQPFIDQITAGQAIDQAKYQTAAQAFLDVERQLYGSTQQYFDALDSVQATTNRAISTVDNATPVTSAVADPFASATASSTATTADNTGTANDLLSQVSGQLTGLQTALAAIAANTAAGGGGGSFIGGTRSFVNAY